MPRLTMTFRKSLLLALALGLPALGQALEFKPSARFDVSGDYNSIPPASTWGADGQIFLLPALRQGDWSFLPLFAALGQSADKVTIENNTFFVDNYTFMARPQLLWQRGSLTYKLLGSAKRGVNRETTSEVWSEGLYDFEEYSGGLGASWTAPFAWLGQGSLSLEDLHRSYMNFHELEANLSGGKNYYSKDYDGWKLALGLSAPSSDALAWNANYTLLLKNFTDALHIEETGELNPGKLRHDVYQHLDGGLNGPLGGHFAWGLQGDFDWNISDQNYFDPVQLQKNLDFYGFLSESLGLSLTWMPWGPDGFSLTPGYLGTLRNYTGRLVRESDGEFRQGLQADTEHTVTLNARWPVLSWMALTAGTDYYSVHSNQAYAPVTPNTFDVFRARLGMDLRY